MAGGRNKKIFNKSNSRKPTKQSLFVEGGLLSDWSPVTTSPHSRGKSNYSNSAGHKSNSSRKKSALRYEIGSTSGGKLKASGSASRMIESQKLKKKAFAYKYPQVSPLVNEGGDERNNFNESNPIVLVDSKDSKIIAYMDHGPITDSETVNYSYDYGASFEVDDTSHIGLGFHVESEEIGNNPVTEKIEYAHLDSSSAHEMETNMIDDDVDNDEDDDDDNYVDDNVVTNSGFLSIGGIKLYTHDISYDDDDDNGNNNDYESLDSEDSCDSSDSDGAYNSDSDIDDEIAEDYFEGIGGTYKVSNVDQLVGQILDSSDDDEEVIMLKGVSGIALQDSSREYNMKKPRIKNKSRVKASNFEVATNDSYGVDDVMLVKNSRSRYGKKKHGAKLPQSWPSKAEKSKHFQRFSGEKKKRSQDMTASKRGVDLEKINFKLVQMVKNRGDMMTFQLKHSRDCSQVQRLATIYRLQSGSQGSGRKRFVTVTRTRHTCMPSSTDRIRLEKLLRNNDMPVDKTPSNRIKKPNLSPFDPKSAKSNESSNKKRREKDKTGSYAAQPVSFISTGNMVSEPETTTVNDHQFSTNNKPVVNSSSYGAFEMHTTGFGSRMMAKMGYVDGSGLGKDGRGISEPIEVIQRPKSLGLGANIPDASEVMNVITPLPPQRPKRLVGQSSRGSESKGKTGNVQFGSFEKHTKGFGSKMMARMGFVEGMGLGRDSQGIVQPLVASRLPKSRGLGAKG